MPIMEIAKNNLLLYVRWRHGGVVGDNWGSKLNPLLVDALPCRTSECWSLPASQHLAVRPATDGFKFRDYWASVGWFDVEPTDVTPEAYMPELLDIPVMPKKEPDMRALLNACPFLASSQRDELLAGCELIFKRPQ